MNFGILNYVIVEIDMRLRVVCVWVNSAVKLTIIEVNDCVFNVKILKF